MLFWLITFTLSQTTPIKTRVLEEEIYAFQLLETTYKISFLLLHIEEELVVRLYFYIDVHVLLLCQLWVLAITMKNKPEQWFSGDCLHSSKIRSLLSSEKQCFLISILFNTTSCRKIFHRFLHFSFTWHNRYPL